MRSNVMIAGAIAALVILCVLAAAAHSLAPQGQPTCSVSGCVINTTGKGLSGLDVTLHVLSYDNTTGTSQELYT